MLCYSIMREWAFFFEKMITWWFGNCAQLYCGVPETRSSLLLK